MADALKASRACAARGFYYAWHLNKPVDEMMADPMEVRMGASGGGATVGSGHCPPEHHEAGHMVQTTLNPALGGQITLQEVCGKVSLT